MKGGSNRKAARRVATKEWRAEALQMRVEGATMREIAARMGKSLSTVHKAIEAEIASIPAEAVEALREVKGAQLDATIAGLLPAAKSGDPQSAHALVGAIREYAKIFGLNAPTRTEMSGKDGAPIVFDFSSLTTEQLRAALAEDPAGTSGAGAGASGEGTGEERGGDE